MIDEVKVEKLNLLADKRGWLGEIYRNDETKLRPLMSYISHTNYRFSRGPHEHLKQTDFFVFIGYGDFEFYLWDNRKKSKTFGKKMKLIVGESNKVKVTVPPGVVHGYKSVSKNGSLAINLPDKLYAGKHKKQKVDEIRYESDADSRFRIK